MKEAAVEYGWPEELKFSGPHCLRHGGVGHVEATQGLEAAIRQAGHNVPRARNVTTEIYAATNQARIDRQSKDHSAEITRMMLKRPHVKPSTAVTKPVKSEKKKRQVVKQKVTKRLKTSKKEKMKRSSAKKRK